MRVLLLSLLLIETLFGELNWAPTYDKAFEQAQREGKGVMIMLSQENCKACWYMENIVFDDEKVVKRVEADFVPLYLDIHHDDIHSLQFSGTPTLYFLNSDKTLIKRLNGVMNIQELTAALPTRK